MATCECFIFNAVYAVYINFHFHTVTIITVPFRLPFAIPLLDMHTVMQLLGIISSMCMHCNMPGVNYLFVLHLCLLQYNVLPIQLRILLF